jgi:hypothetical protein
MPAIGGDSLLVFLTVVAGVALAAIVFWGWRLQRRLEVIEQLFNRFGNPEDQSVEQVLTDLLRRTDRISTHIDDLDGRQRDIDGRLSSALRKLALLRFNPFEDTGGDQSFALALLDEDNSGLILSSLHAREGTRVYVKPVEKGVSAYHLAEEEKDVLRRAVEL